MSIPPLPAISDALSLLTVLADPDKSKAVLAELKIHAENAQKILDDARAAQNDAREASAAALKAKQEIASRQATLDAEQEVLHAKETGQNKTFADMNAALQAQKDNQDAREAKLRDWADELAKREQSLNSGAVDFKSIKDGLDAREKSLNELADIIRPVAEKLGVAL